MHGWEKKRKEGRLLQPGLRGLTPRVKALPSSLFASKAADSETTSAALQSR